MVAFAVGGLLGDTIFHLLPEIFLGESCTEHVRFVLVEPNRNLVLGLAILVGFVTFVAMDKGLRIATGGGGHSHSHPEKPRESAKTLSSGADKATVDGELRLRKKNARTGDDEKDGEESSEMEEKDVNPSVKLGGYLNMMQVPPVSAAPVAGNADSCVLHMQSGFHSQRN